MPKPWQSSGSAGLNQMKSLSRNHMKAVQQIVVSPTICVAASKLRPWFFGFKMMTRDPKFRIMCLINLSSSLSVLREIRVLTRNLHNFQNRLVWNAVISFIFSAGWKIRSRNIFWTSRVCKLQRSKGQN